MIDQQDRELLSACRCGDKEGYTLLMRKNSRRVYGICYAIVGNLYDAQDIAQQTFIKGYTKINKLKNSERFSSWIAQMAKNLSIDFIRQQKRQRTRIDQAPLASSHDKEFFKLHEALQGLPEDYRLVLVLYYFDQKSAKSIAEGLYISYDAARKRLSRAREKLRELLSMQENHNEK